MEFGKIIVSDILRVLENICYSDVTMITMVSQITGVLIVCITDCSGAVQRKRQSSAWLVFVRGIHWWLAHSPRKG